MIEITNKWLEKNNACQEGTDWLKTVKNRDINNIFKLIIKSKNNEKLSWGSWGIVRLMNHKQKIKYAIFAAEQVLSIFEEKYPNDNRPRKAIEAARNYLENPCKETADAAAYAADAAADAAAYAADAVDAVDAADAAAYAAYAADAAAYATAYATNAAYAAIELKIKILTYGMELINENKT